MASILRTLRRSNMGSEPRLHLSPRNNRKRTDGRHIQVDPKTGRVIHHRAGE